MKNILFIENTFGNSYGYYHEIINGLYKFASKDISIRIFNNFQPESKEKVTYNIQSIIDHLKEQGFKVDIVIFGFGWTNTGPYPPNNFIIKEDNIKKYIILNKEYSALHEKLEWIKENNFDAAFTVHHDFKIYQNKTKTPFYHLPFAANSSLFKNYNEKNVYEYDLGFTGIVRPEQTNNWREKIISTFNDKSIWENSRIYYSDHHHDKLEDYAKRICNSKVWLATTSPADLVSTRYYEVMMTGTTLLICNRFDYLNLFEEDKHCIMFDSIEELSEKVKYFTDPKNEKERMEIVRNAQSHALLNHTWVNRGELMWKVIKK